MLGHATTGPRIEDLLIRCPPARIAVGDTGGSLVLVQSGARSQPSDRSKKRTQRGAAPIAYEQLAYTYDGGWNMTVRSERHGQNPDRPGSCRIKTAHLGACCQAVYTLFGPENPQQFWQFQGVFRRLQYCKIRRFRLECS